MSHNEQSIHNRIKEHERLLEIARENGDFASFQRQENEIKFLRDQLKVIKGWVTN